MAKVKTILVKDYEKHNLGQFGNFHKSGSIAGMKKQFYGKNALLVRCGSFIYNVTAQPEIYNNHAH